MPTFHLVVDEVVPVARHRFRVRVWRRADSQPLVLLSQVHGHPPPDWCSSQLANLVLRTFLGYSRRIPDLLRAEPLGRTDSGRSGSATTPSAANCARSLSIPGTNRFAPTLLEHVFGRKPDTLN